MMSVTRYTPHTVLIKLPNGAIAAESIYMGNSKELIYQVRNPTIVNDLTDGIGIAKPAAPPSLRIR